MRRVAVRAREERPLAVWVPQRGSGGALVHAMLEATHPAASGHPCEPLAVRECGLPSVKAIALCIPSCSLMYLRRISGCARVQLMSSRRGSDLLTAVHADLRR